VEVNFDKQIDTILRDLAKGNGLGESPPVSHLDADELSAFAENALPAKARLRAMEHLADCQNCRKILSTFVSLGDANESETIHEEVKTIAVIPAIPWYRQLFAFPQLSYLMGALALVLTGAIGLLLYQNSQDLQNNVAMSEPAAEKVKGPSGASSEGDAPVTYSANAANSVANASAPAANASAPAANAPSTVTNSSVSSNTTVTNSTSATAPKPTATPASVESANTMASADAPTMNKGGEGVDRDAKDAKEDAGKKGEAEKKQPSDEVSATPAPNVAQSRNDDNLSRQQVTEQNIARNQTVYPDSGNETKRSAPSAPASVARKSTARNREEQSQSNDVVGDGRKNKAEPKATPKPTVFKDVAGKSFRSVGGIWTDTAYKGGSTTNVRRGTDNYKKLDSGLRSTADYLGGTVIIVWKGKNYKIQ
jgi:hypothetical protein